MDLGALEVQIFASLVLVLGTVFVALVCDFLKGNNEFLRERNIELRVRQQERQRLSVATGVPAVATARASAAAYPAAAVPATVTRPADVPAAKQRRAETRESSRRQPSRWARPEELSEINDLAQRIRSRIDAKPEPKQETAEETTPEVQEPQRAETVPQPLDVTAADVKHAPRKVEPEPQRPLATPNVTAKVTPIDRLVLESSATEAIDLAEELARVASLNGGGMAEASKELEEAIASAEAETAVPAEEPTRAEAEESPVSTAPERVSLPSGMLDRDAFNELMESDQLLSATVMAVGVGGLESAHWEEESAIELIRSLVEEGEMACRTDEDSFVLVFPNLHGADGQRRISQASQRLWDHQIRSVGRSPIMFSWGATDTARDTLAAVTESARERMEQTRRNRERAPRKIHQYRVVSR